MPLTKRQYIGLNVANYISSPLSIAGSATIISLIIRRHRRQIAGQGRGQEKLRLSDTIVLLLSCGDLLVSTSNLFQNIGTPKGTEGAYWAIGNEHTCSALGFLVYFGSQWVAGINCFLSIYFLLSIRYSWREQDFTKCIKGVCLLVVLLVPIATSSFTASHNAFNYSSNTQICITGDYPDGCRKNEDVECERGETSLPGTLFFAVMSMFGLTGFASTVMVYWTVRSRIRRTLRHGRSWAENVSMSNNTSGRDDIQNNLNAAFTSTRRHSTSLGSSLTSGQQERIRQTAWQAVFYSLAFFNFFVWPFVTYINQIVNNGQPGDHEQEPLWFSLNLLTWFFYPLQGFFNAMVYLRPDIIRWRKLNPNISIFWILNQSIIQGNEPYPSQSLHMESDQSKQGVGTRMQQEQKIEHQNSCPQDNSLEVSAEDPHPGTFENGHSKP
jgi:hypothetical protein